MAKFPKPYYRAQRKTWCVQIGDRQITLGADRKEAFAEYHRLMASEGRVVPTAKLTTHDLCELFLGHVDRNLKPSTLAWYTSNLQSFDDKHGDQAAKAIKPLHVTGWLDDHPTWGASTRRGAITAVKRCWAWAVEEGYLEANPLASIKRPKQTRRTGITADEGTKVIAAIQSSALAEFVAAMLEIGCRPGELSTLTASDLAPDGRSATVHGKQGSRLVVLTAKATELVSRLATKNPSGPIFLNTRGKPWNRNSLRCAFRLIRERTGIAGAVPYALRHLFGTAAIERGVDSLLVAELMGHKDVSMLQEHYAHHKAETLRRAAERATGGEGSGTSP